MTVARSTKRSQTRTRRERDQRSLLRRRRLNKHAAEATVGYVFPAQSGFQKPPSPVRERWLPSFERHSSPHRRHPATHPVVVMTERAPARASLVRWIPRCSLISDFTIRYRADGLAVVQAHDLIQCVPSCDRLVSSSFHERQSRIPQKRFDLHKERKIQQQCVNNTTYTRSAASLVHSKPPRFTTVCDTRRKLLRGLSFRVHVDPVPPVGLEPTLCGF